MIEKYSLGLITIDGKDYGQDVEVRWTGEVLPWLKEHSHLIDLEDIKRALEERPEVIVVGNGELGTVQVTEEVKRAINVRGIELIIDFTEEATKTFNIIKEESKEEEGVQKKVIGLFHLTS